MLEGKGEVALFRILVTICILLFLFFVADISFSYVLVHGQAVPVIDLLPTL